MKFDGRELAEWQQQVWDAKETIYQQTKGKSFREYLENIRKGADAFRVEGQIHLPRGPSQHGFMDPVDG